MQEVYVVKNCENRLNMYVMGVFSSRDNAVTFIKKVEELVSDSLLEIALIPWKLDYEYLEGF